MRSTSVLLGVGMVGLLAPACGEERDFGNGRPTTTQNTEASGVGPTSTVVESSPAAEHATVTAEESSVPATVPETYEAPNGDVESTTERGPEAPTASSEPASSGASYSDTSAPPVVEGPVKGRVIDFWGNPVPNLDINIEGKHATTDDEGAFELAVDGETYDVSFVVDIANPRTVYGWRFEHLSRRDPTLQIYTGLEGRESTMLTTFGTDLSPNDLVGLGLATENGNYSTLMRGPAYLTPDWRGPTQTLANLHALWWSGDEESELPTAYVGYYEGSVALTAGQESNVVLELQSGRHSVATVAGNVACESAVSRANSVYVQFQDGASIQVVDDDNPTSSDAFTYLAPSLPNASLIVAARKAMAMALATS